MKLFCLGAGWFLTALALLQIPFWALHVIFKGLGITWTGVFQQCLHGLNMNDKWGPKNPAERKNWEDFRAAEFTEASSRGHLWLQRIPDGLHSHAPGSN